MKGYAFLYASWRLSAPSFVAFNLFDLQATVLSILYTLGVGFPTTVWAALGHAIRRALDVGAHRKVAPQWNASILQDELRKRAFWSLFILDREMSANLGRPVALQLDDIDVGRPLVIDDDSLEELDAKNFPFPRDDVQISPSGSLALTSFNHRIDLSIITGKALSSIYGIKPTGKSDLIQPVTVELDSLLNLWLDQLDPELRWTPNDTVVTRVAQRGALLMSVRRV